MSNETDLQESAVQEEGAQEEANRETDLHEYTTYPRRFISYRWFKPVLVGLISLILYIAVIVAAFLAVYFGGINRASINRNWKSGASQISSKHLFKASLRKR